MPFNPYEIQINQKVPWKISQAGARQVLNGDVVSDQCDRQAIASFLRIVCSQQILTSVGNSQGLSPEQRSVVSGFKSLSGMDS